MNALAPINERQRQAACGRTLVVGLGRTGLSSARFLARRGVPLRVIDSRRRPPGLAALQEEFPALEIVCGEWEPALLDGCRRLLLSPGFPASDPFIALAREQGLTIINDIDLFAEQATAPVVAVTGSNGKSTVVTMLVEIARRMGLQAVAGGNIGTPVLDLLANDAETDLYVLELSSFQLETTSRLRPQAAAILNVSPDHLDRYDDMAAYRAAKLRLLENAGHIVLPRHDAALMAAAGGRSLTSFALDEPQDGHYGLRRDRHGQEWLACGEERLLPVDVLALTGRHNVLNALAACALLDGVAGIERRGLQMALSGFRGLPHRMQRVAEHNGVLWVNDSKATNPGATEAALAGLERPVILIAGGQSKGADLSSLRTAAAGRVRAAILLGADAARVEAALAGVTDIVRVADMPAAVREAAGLARPGDMVLLSPACASLDMFASYEARGDAFVAAIEAEVQR